MNSNKKALRLAGALAAVECSYLAASRWAFWSFGPGITSELWRTGIRGAAALCLYLLFKDFLFSRQAEPGYWHSPFAQISLAFFVLAGLVPVAPLAPTSAQWVFIATSMVVGIHEEFLFRGLILNWLRGRMGNIAAILLTTILFCVFHLGLRSWHAGTYLLIALLGISLCAAYLLSGSLWLVVVLHSGYDMLDVMHGYGNRQVWDALVLFSGLSAVSGIVALVLRERRLGRGQMLR